MNPVLAFIQAHAVELLIAQYIFGCVMSSLPEPVANGSPYYLFVYRFVHTLAANWDKVTAKTPPQDAKP